MEEVALIVGVILAVYGLTDIVERLAIRVLFPRRNSCYRVIPLCGACGDMEYTVRALVLSRRMLSCTAKEEIVLLDCGLTEEGRRIAHRICDEFDLCFCAKEEWDEMLSVGLQVKKTVI